MNLGAGELIERLQIFVWGDPGVRHDQDPVLDVIEREHRVEQHEPGVVLGGSRRPGRVPPGLLEGGLEGRRGVVADEADRAAREARQPRDVRRSELRHQPPKHGDEGLVRFGPHAGSIERRDAAAGLEDEKRILSEERVPRHALAAFDALEEE